MYIGPQRKKRRSPPMRILLLLLLISAGIYVYTMIKQEQIESPFVPTPTPTRSALSYADEAEIWYLEGKLSDAIASYDKAIALDPADVLLYIPSARLLALEGRAVEAIRRAQKAVEMAPENARAWAVLGMAYDWNGDVSEAIDACKRAIDLDPTYAEAYAYLAEAYIDAGRWVEATEAAQTALKLDDRSVDAYRNYGYVLELQGNYWEALEAYKKALEIHPYLAYLHISVGKNYGALGDFDSAVLSYQRAIEINPGKVEAYYRLGRAYFDIEEYERAEAYLKQAVETDPEFGPAYSYLAYTYYRRRNYEDTIITLEAAIDLACVAARREAEAFSITVEDLNAEMLGPSMQVVMRGDLTRVSTDAEKDGDILRAVLVPKDEDDERWASAQGVVTLNTRTGKYTVKLEGLPALRYGQGYFGWFEGVNTLSGGPLSPGRLLVKADGSMEAEFETGWVEGPRIEYFYTLGLAYFYMAECERSYPLFDAALQIDPEDYSALEGVRLCQEAEAGGTASP